MRDNNIQIGGENNKQTVSNSTRKEMEKEPLIKISKGGDNFKMIDCEVVSGNRPALKTEALNTELIRTTLSQNTSTPEKDAELKQFSSWWKKPEFVIPTVIALVSVPWWPQILESLGF